MFPWTAGGFGGVYGGGSYPGYSNTAGSGIGGVLSSSIGPYPSENPGGYWGHVGGHGADIPPFLGQGAVGGGGGGGVNNYGFGSTPAVIGSSIPPYITPSVIPSGLPPIGGPPLGPPLGIPSVPGYFGGGGVGAIGGGGLDANRPFNIRCDDNDGFKQVIILYIENY